jgi:hypothetical protein
MDIFCRAIGTSARRYPPKQPIGMPAGGGRRTGRAALPPLSRSIADRRSGEAVGILYTLSASPSRQSRNGLTANDFQRRHGVCL